MMLILLALGCISWHEEKTTTSLVGGGGTASTFYVIVSEQTYDTTSWPGGYSSTRLVSDDATLVRCDVTAVDHRRQTSCDAAITLDQARKAAYGAFSFTTLDNADTLQNSRQKERRSAGQECVSSSEAARLRERLAQIVAAGTLPSELPSLPPECQ